MEDRPRRSPLPDVTPVVNVALVLLIVFMVVTPMIREGIEVETPEAEGVEQLSEDEQNVVLAVQSDGSMFVNLKPVQPHTLEAELILAYPDQWLWIHRRWKSRPVGESRRSRLARVLGYLKYYDGPEFE